MGWRVFYYGWIRVGFEDENLGLRVFIITSKLLLAAQQSH